MKITRIQRFIDWLNPLSILGVLEYELQVFGVLFRLRLAGLIGGGYLNTNGVRCLMVWIMSSIAKWERKYMQVDVDSKTALFMLLVFVVLYVTVYGLLNYREGQKMFSFLRSKCCFLLCESKEFSLLCGY